MLKRGHEFPTYVPGVSQKLVVPSSQSKRPKHFEYLHIDKFYMAIANQITEIVYLDIDMSRSITISRIFAHHNARSIILPYFCGLLLKMTKAISELTKVYYFLASLTCSHKLCFAAA